MVKVLEDVLTCHTANTDAVPSLSSAEAEAPPADGVDRISALPDDLLRDVVSRLPACDGARTAALSSRWRPIWRFAPLVLRDVDLLAATSFEDERAYAAAATATVGRVLADHPGPFRKVQLTCCASGSRERELAERARLLAAKDVRDLVLFDVDNSAEGMVRRLPDNILSCASLHRLFLGSWIGTDTAALVHHGTDVVFPLLKHLSVFNSIMRDKDLDHMLACSPVLEILALTLIECPERIRLRNQSLQCMLLWMYLAEELALVDAPHLERLILWMTCADDESGDDLMVVKIDRAPVLRVLGYLEPRVHQLQIGNIVINAETAASPSSIVPSVKILALKVNFGIFEDFNMLPSFLRCFPNIETLHIESYVLGEETGGHHAKFWQEIHPIECVKSHVKEIVFHEFQGDRGEFEFLKFIAKSAQKLQSLLLVLTKEKFASADKVHEVNCQLGALCACTENCKILLLGSEKECVLSFRRASDLSVKDPFV